MMLLYQKAWIILQVWVTNEIVARACKYVRLFIYIYIHSFTMPALLAIYIYTHVYVYIYKYKSVYLYYIYKTFTCIQRVSIFYLHAGDLSVAGAAAKPIEKGDDDSASEDLQPGHHEFEDPNMLSNVFGSGDELDEELDPDIHNGWMFVDSESDGDEPSAPVACEHSKVTRTRISEERPEFQELAMLGLVERPSGCTIGIHPEAMVWRASASGCSHHGRSFTASCGRTPKQALLRVIELMLLDHLEKEPQDRLAKKQLVRVQEARAAEPKHKN